MRRTDVLLHAVLAAIVVSTAGCGSGGDGEASPTSDPSVTSSTPSPEDRSGTTAVAGDGGEGGGDAICPSAAELETALGGPVQVESSSGASMSGSMEMSISFSYEGCDVELSEGGQGQVSISRVTAAEVDGEQQDGSVFEVLRDAASADFDDDGFEQLAELGAEAYRDGTQVVFLDDDVMVFVEVEVDGEESVDASLDMAAALIGSSQPIPSEDLDCSVLGQLAPEDFGPVTDVSVSGGSTSIGDLDLQRTGCGADHENGYESSITVTEASQWQAWIAAKEGSTFSARYSEVDVAGRAGFDDGERLVIDDGDSPWVITASGDDLDPDPAGVRLRVAELALGA
jgi:hypothetical protein